MNKLLIGCAGVLLVGAILVGVLILETPRFLEAGRNAVKNVVLEEGRVAALESAWQAPTPAPDVTWFPAEVGEWKRESAQPAGGIVAIGLQRPGYGAVYRSVRGWVEVHVVPAEEGEKPTLLRDAQEALRARPAEEVARTGGGSIGSSVRESARLTTSRGNRTLVRIGSSDHTRFWFLKGQLFVFRAYGQADSEAFPEAFLRASSAAPLPPA